MSLQGDDDFLTISPTLLLLPSSGAVSLFFLPLQKKRRKEMVVRTRGRIKKTSFFMCYFFLVLNFAPYISCLLDIQCKFIPEFKHNMGSQPLMSSATFPRKPGGNVVGIPRAHPRFHMAQWGKQKKKKKACVRAAY